MTQGNKLMCSEPWLDFPSNCFIEQNKRGRYGKKDNDTHLDSDICIICDKGDTASKGTDTNITNGKD